MLCSGELKIMPLPKENKRSRKERDALLHLHRRLPFYIVRKFSFILDGNGVSRDDALQVCWLSLIRAAELFDPEWDCTFSTYAVRCGYYALVSHCTKEGMIRLPNQMSLRQANRYRKKNRMIFMGYGDIAVSNLRSQRQGFGVREKRSRSRDFLAEEKLWHILTTRLGKRQFCVIHDIFFDGKTLSSIAEEFHITMERVRQIRIAAIQRLRRIIPDSIEEALM
jgi:RNA polymerase sigma factor (sigma-70 family)